MKMIPYAKQSIDQEDIDEVVKVLKSDFITSGPKIKEFEEKFSDFVGAKYAVAVCNGTAALHLACLAAGLKQGDELITSAMTFAASANCALYCNAKPVFVDIKENGSIDEDKINEKISWRTKIILPVHFTGLPCNLEKINKIAKKHNLIVIEDACHALGAKYKDSKIGDCQYSNMVVFSFHPVKHITTGEGAIITTNSLEFYEKLKVLRNHGLVSDPEKLINKDEGPWHREIQELGYNFRITDIQCALGLSQLKKVNDFITKRRQIAKRYDDAFKDLQDIDVISEEIGTFNSYHLYIIKLKNSAQRLSLFKHLKEKEVFSQVHYLPVYWHPVYQKLGYKKGLCPVAEDFYQRILSIPMFPDLKKQDYVINAIKEGL